MGGKVTGLTVVIASRIMAAAAPGEVLVSSTVRDLAAGSSLTFEDRGVRGAEGRARRVARLRGRQRPTEMVDDDRGHGDGQRTACRRGPPGRGPTDLAAPAAPRRGDGPRRWPLILATGGLLVAKPWQPAALASVAEDSIGIIDPGRDEVIGEIAGRHAPRRHRGRRRATRGSPTPATTRSRRSTSPHARWWSGSTSGNAPKGIAVAGGLVWVANSGERTVSRINTATGRVVGDPIDVGNGPTAIAAAGDGLWVANATDSTIVRIDAAIGRGRPAGSAWPPSPVALAADEDGLWVASEDGASVSHHDPVTGATRRGADPAQCAADRPRHRPDIGLGGIRRRQGHPDRSRRRRRDGDRSPSAAVWPPSRSAATAIWVGDLDGTVYRLDAANPSSPPRQISTSSAVASLAVVDGGIWLAAQASARSHRGGTLRIVEAGPTPPGYDTDPLGVRSTTSTLARRRMGSSATGASAAAPVRHCCPISRPRLR